MRPIPVFLILAASLMVLCNYSCKKECEACETCYDGIQNGDETGIDCGGSCQPCATFCNDGKLNGDETDIDCGGSCCPCPVEIGWSAYTEWENPRTHMASVLLGDKLYVSGGFDFLYGGNILGTFEVFDFSTGVWETLAEMNEPRCWHSMKAIGDTLYVMGGMPDYSGDALTSIERYIIGGEDKWEIIGEMPERRAGFKSCVLDGKIYVIGGLSKYPGPSISYSSERVYDPEENEWTLLATQLPAPIGPCAGAEELNGKIYVIAAFEPSISEQNLVLEYDPDRPELGWVTKGVLTVPSFVGSTCVLDDWIFYLGGFGGDTYPGHPVWTLAEVYSQQKGCVFGATEMPKGRYGHASCVYQGDLYVFGGIEIAAVGSPAVSTVWRGVLQP